MPGTFFGIEIARRGMRVHQSALDITGHNVANASTPGYSRQEAVIKTTNPHWVPSMDSYATPGQFGTGAEVSEIRRIKDEYLDNNVRQSNTNRYYWQEQVPFLGRAQALFAEPATQAISKCITDFFKAWMDVNNSPQDTGAKAAVVQQGEQLASMLNTTYEQLGNVADSIAQIDGTTVKSGKMHDDINRINEILTQIWDLNDSIQRVYGVNQQPNDLLDRRDMLLEELSQYGPVKVQFAHGDDNKPTGEIAELKFFNKTIDTSADAPPVIDLKVEDVVNNEGEPKGKNIILTANGEEIINLTKDCTDNSTGGSLLGMERARQYIVGAGGYQEYLTNLSEQLADKMPKSSIETGDDIPFFTGTLGGEGENKFQVHQELLNDASQLDGKKASEAVKWRDDPIGDLDNCTFNQYYALLVTKVGANTRQADDMTANQQAINHQITALRDSVSGVAINEELTRMIQFQYGFQASARMINTLDAMLDVVINRLF